MYGIVNANEATTLKAVQETKVHEIIAQVGPQPKRFNKGVNVYGIVNVNKDTTLKAVQETKVREIIAQVGSLAKEIY